MSGEIITISFAGGRIIDKNFILYLLQTFKHNEKLVLRTANKSVQIKITLSELLNVNDSINKTLIMFPKLYVTISNAEILEEYFDINDDFALTYINNCNSNFTSKKNKIIKNKIYTQV